MDRRTSVAAGLALSLALGAFALAAPMQSLRGYAAPAGSSSKLAQVRYIDHGLFVQPPNKKSQKGTLKMALYAAYQLQTKQKERASIMFQDKTTLHMNQLTQMQLLTPHLTYVSKGQVDEALQPGTSHKVQTASAVASAIGTNFGVKIATGGSIFLVLHGVIQVKNKKGKVTVKPNQETVVVNGQAPQPPKHVDAAKELGWTSGLPMPNLPENVALDAAGGKVVDFSSQYTSATEGNFWKAAYINDGRLDFGWQSASGDTTDQWVKIELAGGKTYKVTGVLIDPAATHGDPASSDMKDFEILASTTGTSDSDFTSVLKGTCQQKNSLQSFTFSTPAQAKYIELIAHNNYGSPDWISVAEMEVLGS